ncbi:hypothetical protein FRC02_004829, partial [Tulasnella sp. 418]
KKTRARVKQDSPEELGSDSEEEGSDDEEDEESEDDDGKDRSDEEEDEDEDEEDEDESDRRRKAKGKKGKKLIKSDTNRSIAAATNYFVKNPNDAKLFAAVSETNANFRKASSGQSGQRKQKETKPGKPKRAPNKGKKVKEEDNKAFLSDDPPFLAKDIRNIRIARDATTSGYGCWTSTKNELVFNTGWTTADIWDWMRLVLPEIVTSHLGDPDHSNPDATPPFALVKGENSAIKVITTHLDGHGVWASMVASKHCAWNEIVFCFTLVETVPELMVTKSSRDNADHAAEATGGQGKRHCDLSSPVISPTRPKARRARQEPIDLTNENSDDAVEDAVETEAVATPREPSPSAVQVAPTPVASDQLATHAAAAAAIAAISQSVAEEAQVLANDEDVVMDFHSPPPAPPLEEDSPYRPGRHLVLDAGSYMKDIGDDLYD